MSDQLQQAVQAALNVDHFRHYLSHLEAVIERARDLLVPGVHTGDGTFECSSEDAQELHQAIQRLDQWIEQQDGGR